MSTDAGQSEDRRKQFVPSAVARLRLEGGELFADLITDRRTHPPIVFCVVQRHGSAEVLFLGQFQSSSEAEQAAREIMSDYRRRHQGTGSGQGIYTQVSGVTSKSAQNGYAKVGAQDGHVKPDSGRARGEIGGATAKASRRKKAPSASAHKSQSG